MYFLVLEGKDLMSWHYKGMLLPLTVIRARLCSFLGSLSVGDFFPSVLSDQEHADILWYIGR